MKFLIFVIPLNINYGNKKIEWLKYNVEDISMLIKQLKIKDEERNKESF